MTFYTIYFLLTSRFMFSVQTLGMNSRLLYPLWHLHMRNTHFILNMFQTELLIFPPSLLCWVFFFRMNIILPVFHLQLPCVINQTLLCLFRSPHYSLSALLQPSYMPPCSFIRLLLQLSSWLFPILSLPPCNLFSFKASFKTVNHHEMALLKTF